MHPEPVCPEPGRFDGSTERSYGQFEDDLDRRLRSRAWRSSSSGRRALCGSDPELDQGGSLRFGAGGLALLLYVPGYTLVDIGAVELVVAVGATWVISFLLAPLPLGAWQVGRVALKAIRR